MEYSDLSKIKRLIFLHITDNISNDELNELNEWRNLDSANEELFVKVTSQHFLRKNIKRAIRSKEFVELEWEKIKIRTIKQSRRRILLFTRYAAALLLILTTALGIRFFIEKNEAKVQKEEYLSTITHQGTKAILTLSSGEVVELKQEVTDAEILEKCNFLAFDDAPDHYKSAKNSSVEEEMNKLITEKAHDYKLTLSDGSTITLNAESELIFPVVFKNRREVFLKGQAFFEITKDESRPFIVNLDGAKIIVTGTSFCVTAYEDENKKIITLVEGAVNISTDKFSYDLNPNQQAIIDNEINKLCIKDVDSKLFTSWKDGRIVFDNESLEEIMRYLKRIYPVEIIFKNREVMEIPFSMNINKHNSFLEIVTLLEKSNYVQFDYQTNEHYSTIIIK